MMLPKIRELKEAVIALIKGPYTSAFPAKRHTPHPSFRGKPTFQENGCVGCMACENVCPVEAIAHEDILDGDIPMRRMIHYKDTCIFCGQCVAHCLTQEGIVKTTEWELSFFDRETCAESIDKELARCEVCGGIIATRDHLVWLATELGELAYSNPTLYQTRLQELGLSDREVQTAVDFVTRQDRMKLNCARCRRTTTLTTETPPQSQKCVM